MRKRKILRVLTLALVTASALALSFPASGADVYEKTITVYTGVKIMVDGVELFPTDAGGNPVDPFIHAGTTYLPVRAISEALKKPVNWDGATRTVYIGKIPGQDMYLSDVCPPYQTNCIKRYDYITLAGNKYLDNLAVTDYNGWALYNLNGQFNTLEFDVGHIDGERMVGGTLNIYLDGVLAHTHNLTGEMLPAHVVVPLNGALQMKIEFDISQSLWGANYAIVNATIE